MFESFTTQERTVGERRRWAMSLGIGAVAYAGILAGAVVLGGATPPAPPQEEPLAVVFAPPPPPPPPAPASAPAAPAAPLVSAPRHLKRKPPDPGRPPRKLEAPAKIAAEKPAEKDAADFAVAAAAPGAGDAAGLEGGSGITGTLVASLAPAPAPAPRRVRRQPVQLPENATPPRLLEATTPVFPPEMKEQGKEGLVVLKVVIDENGRLAGIRPMKGEEPFLSAAIAWAQASRWAPAVAASGERLPVFKILQIPFRLRM